MLDVRKASDDKPAVLENVSYLGILVRCTTNGYGWAVVLNSPSSAYLEVYVHHSEIVGSPKNIKLGDTLRFQIVEQEPPPQDSVSNSVAQAGQNRFYAKDVRILKRATGVETGFSLCPCCRRVLPDAFKRLDEKKTSREKYETSLKARFGEKYLPPEQRQARTLSTAAQ